MVPISPKKLILFLTLLILLLLTVGFWVFQPTAELFSVSLENDAGSEKIELWENGDGDFYIFLPGYAELETARIALNTDTEILLNGELLYNGMSCEDFAWDVSYGIEYTVFGKQQEKRVTFMRSSHIATLFLDTETGDMEHIHSQKGNKEAGTARLYEENGALNCDIEQLSIKGRGNATWTDHDKKPYRISLGKEESLLGMGSASEWVLLANAADHTHLRNKIVYDFAGSVGLMYSPESEWVDLYLNREYAGLYLLCERNEVHPERVDIDPTKGVLVSLELEERLKAQNYPHIVTDDKKALRTHYPRNVSSEQLEKIEIKWQTVENAILAENGRDPTTGVAWQDLIDLDSWVRKYLIEEVFGNYDAGTVSQYFYFDGLGKIYAGPVWDYDNAIGRAATWQLRNPQTLFANRAKVSDSGMTPWFYSLYQKDVFYNRLVEVYQQDFLPQMKSLLSNVEVYSEYITQAAEMNRIRWSSEDSVPVSEAVSKMKEYIEERLVFLNRIWLKNEPYCQICADGGFGVDYAHYAVITGECLSEVPALEDTDTLIFSGWYYAATDEPFDITKPITEDIEIYAKWEDKPVKKIKQAAKLLPLGVIAVLGVGLLVADIRRNRKT